MQLAAVPPLAVFDAWLYAALCSMLLGILLVRSCRAINRQEHLAAQGLLLMLASDFAQRHDAITTTGAMGWGEAGWAAGLGLVAVALRGGKGELPWRASNPQAPWRSARCVLGGLTFAGNVVLLAGALWGDLLAITEGAQLTALLWLVWIGWFVSNALAVRLHEAMERIGALMPAPHITWCQAQHPMTVALKPITPRTRLAEFDGWVARYNQLVGKLNPLIAQVSRHQEAYAYQQMAEHVAHDIRAPVAALQSALDALQGREAEPARILSQAAARIHDVAQTLLNARRHLGHAHPPGHVHGQRPDTLPQGAPNGAPPALPPVAMDPYDTAPLGRIVELVQRDLGLRHGKAWAEAVLWAFEPCELRAPLTAVVTALGNLLDNSIEATPIGPGAVRITAVRGPNVLELQVVDRGPGMPPHVFDALGKRSITAGKRDGNGLGVLGAAQAARAWGGSLSFTLPPEGGTTAVLTLPLAQAKALSEGEAVADVTVLVDDDPLVRAAWQLSAQHAGAPLITFKSSEACLKGVGALSPSTQFYLDTQLGGDMTGHDLARVLMSMGFGQVVVMQSAGGGGSAPFGPGEPPPYPVAASKRAPFAARNARAA
jgi:signal transduction histidine kinase